MTEYKNPPPPGACAMTGVLLFAAMIAMPDASGKSALCLKHPDKFQDIDEFVWKYARDDLLNAFASGRAARVNTIYRTTMMQHRHELDRSKLLLSHSPADAQWLEITCVARIKPSVELFEMNLRCKRQPIPLLELATQAYHEFNPAEVYDTREGIEKRCLDLWGAWKTMRVMRLNAVRILREDQH